MSIIVTGGFGHIGSWVCRELVKKGQHVIAVDLSSRNLSYLSGMEESITHAAVDVLDQAALNRVFTEHKDSLDGVIHIAGLIGGPVFTRSPRDNINLNVMGTVNLLEASRLFKVRRFVYISSGAVYGVRDNTPLEDEAVTPGDLYGAAKASAEFLGKQYANEFGLDFRSVRVYFAYGPGKLPSEVTPLHNAVFGCLVGDTKISLPAGADQSIDFTYIEDIARAIRLVYEKPELRYREYNVSSGVCYEIPDLIQKVADYAGRSVELTIGPGRIMPRGPSIDSSRLIDEFGFSAEYDIARGVEKYAAWLDE